ncbi:beta-lactamase family protein [Fulvivirga sp. 29W222]|uniref:Beta-lactamase family protein n=1 Tax=Fulvivirga marina TaxID=2494733 RepID=A0A937FXT9_9BACT|nr:serine hydrolase domain-containing protein [Fulvivirga marina]MBL6446355.1 beta-lactamase family protein [Fulvivirga marina]
MNRSNDLHCIKKVNKKKVKYGDDYSTEIDNLILKTFPRSFNGVVHISQNGINKYLRAHGYSDFKTKKLIDINDNFRIQSITKQITAVLILKEAERGKINLENPIGCYLPKIRQKWAETVTVHQLLNMTSGITDIEIPLAFEPGTNFYYSNPAYILLGGIIESITGTTYSEKANCLLEELRMYNSFCYEIDNNSHQVINGHFLSKDEHHIVHLQNLGVTKKSWPDFVSGCGIISNTKDLCIWNTKLHGGKLLRPETYRLMTTYNIKMQTDAFGKEKVGYGYGVIVDDNNHVKLIGHMGRGAGFVSIMFYIPKTDVNVIVFENVYNENESIVYHFEDKIREVVMNSSLATIHETTTPLSF